MHKARHETTGLFINILLVVVLVMSVPIGYSIYTMYALIYSIVVEFGAAFIALTLIFLRDRRLKKHINSTTWAALVAWLLIPTSYMMLYILGGDFGTLAAWIITAIILGLISVVLTAVELFRSNR